MVDNVNPTSQFHPYQPMDDTPQSERSESGLAGLMKSGSLGKLRRYARANPGKVLGWRAWRSASACCENARSSCAAPSLRVKCVVDDHARPLDASLHTHRRAHRRDAAGHTFSGQLEL